MSDKKEVVKKDPPQNIGAFSRYKTGNSCRITGRKSDVMYARNTDEGRSGTVYCLEGLVKKGLVDEIKHTGIDEKLIAKLATKNFVLVSQVKLIINASNIEGGAPATKTLGLTKDELETLKRVLFLGGKSE